ncbi:MAG: pre-60S factor REI1 [Bacillariaceae sp.]|jgi:pre-60S factor REI1
MINKEHCKVRYEEGFWDELDPFYDFRKDNKEFVGDDEEGSEMDVDNNDAIKEEDDGWEDMSDGDNDDDDESKEIYEGYEREIARFGLDVTALGELVFPDGRVVGHRALHRYYKQRLRSSTSNKPSVQAAQAAAGERLYDGRVISINEHKLKQGEAASGSGKGILVSGGGAAFSTLSLYRFRAAIRKQRKGDEKGRRLKYRQSLNMNRMDKKANRLMNGVSVAHAKR